MAVVLRGARIRLRPLRPSDAEAVFTYASEPGFFRFIDVPARLREHYTREDASAFIAESADRPGPRHATWAIHQDGVVVGSIRLRPAAWRPGAVEVGVGLAQQARGAGLATEALRLVLAWWRTTGQGPLWARCHRDNRASMRLLARCGFAEAGTDAPWRWFRADGRPDAGAAGGADA